MYGMERFPALSIIVKYGFAGAVISAFTSALLVVYFSWQTMGWPTLLISVGIAVMVFLAAKAIVELVTILTEMLVPK